jgi:hypothetical protein
MTERAQFPFGTEYVHREGDVARGDGYPEQVPVPDHSGAFTPTGEAGELVVTRSRQSVRYWKLGVLTTVAAVLVIALVALLPPLIHQDRGAAPGGAALGDGPRVPPPGVPPGCPPPIGPPPDVGGQLPPVAQRPPSCPGPPRAGPGYRLVLVGKQLDLPAATCHSGIDLDRVAITGSAADVDLTYEPCGRTADLLRVPGRSFGAAAGVYAQTGADCRTHALGQPMSSAPQHAPNLVGYCVITSRSRIAHVLVQAWGATGRPNLRLQVTLWQKA